MKIGDSRRVGAAQKAAPAARTMPAAEAARAARADSPAAVAEIMGIPEAEFTPKVQAAIMALMAEVEKLRQELHQSQQRVIYLEQLADQDSLTPVINRRAFVRELSRMMSFAERYGAPSSMVYFDVNGLKAINDTLGHAAGDAVLAEVAQTLVKNVRESDVVGRLGGDEFGVILAYADQPTANEKGAALAAAVAERPVAWADRSINVTVSWGAHSFQDGDAAGALDAADRAMYERKKLGRKPA